MPRTAPRVHAPADRSASRRPPFALLAARASSLLLLAAAAGTAPGCARSPVAEDAVRSPYERYDDLRGRDVPRTTVDSFGRERLNLEGRLGQPDADG